MSFIGRSLLLGACILVASAAFAQGNLTMAPMPPKGLPIQPGQGAFGAIHEIVGMLEADPGTDWSKVNIDAVRQHLIDMDNVTLRATIVYEPIANGERIHVSGDGAVRGSIQRMLMMHAAMAGDTPGWHMVAGVAPDGALVTVTAKSAQGLQKMKALGLIGMLAEGDHHARHHMMLATGSM